MEIRRYGPRAVLVTPDPGVSPARLAAAVVHRDVVEVVPGAETVLVVVRDATRLDSVRRSIEALEGAIGLGPSDGSDREVVLDVVYDGDDLAEIAAASALTVEDVVALHSGGVYRCDFCGFAPGFAYLSGLDERLHLPRRATPRTSVPAGSVAIAGPYTAAYPSDSPGGWHLLGRTEATLWDLSTDPPALLSPGTTVRFRPVESSGQRSLRIPQRSLPRSRAGVLRVVTAGVVTSIQDRGRGGYAHLAVPGSGAVDRRSADLVNRLVGNPPDAAVVETAGGLVLEAVAPGTVADSATGAVQALSLGDTVTVNPVAGELWAYLAVRGGFAAESVLGSRSWDSLSKLGPPPPRPGDVLHAGQDPATPVATDQAPRHPPSEDSAVIRARLGPRADWFGTDAMNMLTTSVWTVATTSRVGVRLRGPSISRSTSQELPSEGLVTGAIQVPPDGQPVVMLVDHPTTGGYPVIAVVEEADLSSLAQRAPGSVVRFRPY